MKVVRSSTLLPTVLALIVVFAGCGRSPRYLTKSKPGVDVSTYSTFDLVEMKEDMPGADPRVVRRAKPIVENALRTTLKAKGYQESKNLEDADFAVVVNAAVLPRSELVEKGFSPAHASEGWFNQYGDLITATNDQDEPEDKALVAVEVYDVQTKELVWFSLSSSIRRPEETNSDRIGRARDLILRLMSEFPTAQAIR